ncbi:CBS domain-containing protein [Gilvimarinus sp. DA14]|uniref:CBS domain-containing protein n=1 Tax=Gilvimarinus sp. DA14 TaxID=2956798 RepID=UPI0020B6A080|nr:CBS domain-containing protein [Gilvimarinus sp. DA14]UTF58606.1 CBS domain-containing protein [Gilvimarinus sp. DA14]
MKAKNLMSSKLVTVEMGDSLALIKEIFDHVSFHHLLVVEGTKLLGVISDRDFFKAISPNLGTPAATSKDLATLQKKAHQIMSRNPVTVYETASILEVVELFNTHSISCVPVVSEHGKPVGIISWRDLMREIGNRNKGKGE